MVSRKPDWLAALKADLALVRAAEWDWTRTQLLHVDAGSVSANG